MKIGIFGGTFDPIHVGHLVAAMNARHTLALDRVLMVVAHMPWQKVGTREITPSDVRFGMVEASVATLDGLEASSIEIDRGGDSYTIDTIETIRAAEPDAEIFLIVGSDVAPALNTWHRFEDVRREVKLAIVDRPGSLAARPPAEWNYEMVEAPLIDLSSTQLRLRMVDGSPVRFLVPDPALPIYRDWWHGRKESETPGTSQTPDTAVEPN